VPPRFMPTTPTQRILARLADSVVDGTFVRLTLSAPHDARGPVQRIVARLVTIADMPHLSLTLRESKRDTTRNLPLAEVPAWATAMLAGPWGSAMLATTTGDLQWQRSHDGSERLITHAPATKVAPSRAHDQGDAPRLRSSAPTWLQRLGCVDAHGRAQNGMGDKVRQVERYVEILGHLLDDGDVRKDGATLIDVGCGRGVLTFAAWHALSERGSAPHVVGVERRPDLVASATAIAAELGPNPPEFVVGDVASVTLPAADVFVALHACNTATDDAIRRGIGAGARVIVVAPCCHQQIRPQLGRPEPLAAVLGHGLMAERMAEWVTDALRTLHLRWAGYRTKVVEFVGSEHTQKNVMIAGLRAGEPFTDVAARDAIVAMREFYGVTEHALDDLLVVAS
jgi:SAM-dependent methyltransferase